jgi:hypothetical protein
MIFLYSDVLPIQPCTADMIKKNPPELIPGIETDMLLNYFIANQLHCAFRGIGSLIKSHSIQPT